MNKFGDLTIDLKNLRNTKIVVLPNIAEARKQEKKRPREKVITKIETIRTIALLVSAKILAR